MKRSRRALRIIGLRALALVLVAALFSGPVLHRAEAGAPDLTRLVEFVQYVTPDGQLPDLCVKGQSGDGPGKRAACTACVAAATGAADLPAADPSPAPPVRLGTPCQTRLETVALHGAVPGVRHSRGPPAA